ncbi:MAG: WG repeat-containing protein [bacterium]
MHRRCRWWSAGLLLWVGTLGCRPPESVGARPKPVGRVKAMPRPRGPLPDLEGGWLDTRGKEVVRVANRLPHRFVTPKLGSACAPGGKSKIPRAALGCVAVHRVGKLGTRLGAKLPGYLVGVLGGKGRTLHYLFTDPYAKSSAGNRLGAVNATFGTVLRLVYRRIQCVGSCRAFVTLTIDLEPSGYSNYSVPVHEYQYKLHDQTGKVIKTLVEAFPVASLEGRKLILYEMTVPPRATVVPFLKKDRWGLVDLKGKVVMAAAHQVIKVLGTKSVLVGNSCSTTELVNDQQRCHRWQVLDLDGVRRWRHSGPVKLPHGEPSQRVNPDRPVIALSKNRCSVLRPNTTTVELSPCDLLKDLSPDGILAFLRSPKNLSELGRWGLTNLKGKIIVPPTWHHIGFNPLSSATHLRLVGGRIPVMVRGTNFTARWGLIDQRGRVVVAPAWDKLDLTDGRVFVKRGGKWGVLNRDGKQILPPQFPEHFSSVHIDQWGDRLPFHVLKTRGSTRVLVTPAGKVLRFTGSLEPAGRQFVFVHWAGVTSVHSVRTGARIVSQALEKKSPSCLSREQARAGVYPIAITGPKGDPRLVLVGHRGVVTRWRYDSLGCLRHGLTPFARWNRRPHPRKRPTLRNIISVPEREPGVEPGATRPEPRSRP